MIIEIMGGKNSIMNFANLRCRFFLKNLLNVFLKLRKDLFQKLIPLLVALDMTLSLKSK